jgi:hypothetical protein
MRLCFASGVFRSTQAVAGNAAVVQMTQRIGQHVRECLTVDLCDGVSRQLADHFGLRVQCPMTSV